MEKMNKDKIKVILNEAIEKAFDKPDLEDRGTYVGYKTQDLMAQAALNILLAVEDVQILMKDEELLK